jgi:short-subunit dehydrogenase
MKDLQQKVVVIIGASQGIGRSVALRLAKEGCILCLIARSKSFLSQVMEDTRLGQDRVFIYPMDASDFAILGGTLKSIESKFGSIDILINTAGLGTFKRLIDTNYNEVIQPMLLPYASAMIACHAVVPGMLQKKSGHIINMTSPAGYIPIPYMVPYTSSRFAMVGLSLSLHEELAGTGVGVTLICPGVVNTGYFERNDALLSFFPRIIRYLPKSEPEDVAEIVYKSLYTNKKEIIFPFVLRLFIRFAQMFPSFAIQLIKFLGLWIPSRIDKK